MNTPVEYIWLDADGGIRSKIRILELSCTTHTQLDSYPVWNYDGSSTGQATGSDSEVELIPVSVVKNPFLCETFLHSTIVLCETSHRESNFRSNLVEYLRIKKDDPWFGFEQEYTILNVFGEHFGWNPTFPSNNGKHYCGNGLGKVYGRELSDAHMKACLIAGLGITGTNQEVMPSQWEYQIMKPGVTACDHLIISRFLLLRCAEMRDMVVCFEPKPCEEWNGSGLHTNYSTISTREKGGLNMIHKYIDALSKAHTETMKVYGKNNSARMTGEHETSHYDVFTSGVANRGASVRIPSQVEKDGRGYLEDRRPSANADPYRIAYEICSVTLLQ